MNGKGTRIFPRGTSEGGIGAADGGGVEESSSSPSSGDEGSSRFLGRSPSEEPEFRLFCPPRGEETMTKGNGWTSNGGRNYEELVVAVLKAHRNSLRT